MQPALGWGLVTRAFNKVIHRFLGLPTGGAATAEPCCHEQRQRQRFAAHRPVAVHARAQRRGRFAELCLRPPCCPRHAGARALGHAARCWAWCGTPTARWRTARWQVHGARPVAGVLGRPGAAGAAWRRLVAFCRALLPAQLGEVALSALLAAACAPESPPSSWRGGCVRGRPNHRWRRPKGARDRNKHSAQNRKAARPKLPQTLAPSCCSAAPAAARPRCICAACRRWLEPSRPGAGDGARDQPHAPAEARFAGRFAPRFWRGAVAAAQRHDQPAAPESWLAAHAAGAHRAGHAWRCSPACRGWPHRGR